MVAALSVGGLASPDWCRSFICVQHILKIDITLTEPHSPPDSHEEFSPPVPPALPAVNRVKLKDRGVGAGGVARTRRATNFSSPRCHTDLRDQVGRESGVSAGGNGVHQALAAEGAAAARHRRGRQRKPRRHASQGSGRGAHGDGQPDHQTPADGRVRRSNRHWPRHVDPRLRRAPAIRARRAALLS